TSTELDQVRADVVVGVAEARIHRDGALALRDGLLVLALIRQRPTEEGVRFRGGANGERALIVIDGFVQASGHLGLVAPRDVLAGLRRPLPLVYPPAIAPRRSSLQGISAALAPSLRLYRRRAAIYFRA